LFQYLLLFVFIHVFLNNKTPFISEGFCAISFGLKSRKNAHI